MCYINPHYYFLQRVRESVKKKNMALFQIGGCSSSGCWAIYIVLERNDRLSSPVMRNAFLASAIRSAVCDEDKISMIIFI